MSLTSFFTIVCFEIDVLVCILFPVQFSKIMCTSAVLIYITKYFPLRQMFFLFFFIFFTVYAYNTIFKRKLVDVVYKSLVKSATYASKT